MGPEARLKRRIREALTSCGWDVQTIETSTGRGVPDLSVSSELTGDIWVETKYGNSVPALRPEQNAWMSRGARKGRVCCVVWGWKGGGNGYYGAIFLHDGTMYIGQNPYTSIHELLHHLSSLYHA